MIISYLSRYSWMLLDRVQKVLCQCAHMFVGRGLFKLVEHWNQLAADGHRGTLVPGSQTSQDAQDVWQCGLTDEILPVLRVSAGMNRSQT